MPAIPNAVALAGWIRLSDVRQPCGLADGPRAVDVPFLQPADLDHGRDDLSPLASAAQDLVLGDLVRLRPEDRRLRAGLQQVLGFGSYETAWAWLHRLRRAMVRPDRELLGGPGVTVELDSTFIGGRQGGRVRNQYLNKQEVAIAVEHRQPSGFGRARLTLIDSQDRKKGFFSFAHACIAPGTVLHTDGDQLFKDLPQHMPITHQRTVLQGVEATAHEALPGVHRVASLLKRWLAGTLHNGHSSAHLSYYLDEFTFRFNRRSSRSRGLLFYRLLQQAAHTDPHPLASLVAAPVTDRDDWS